jgi:hypothetical protein
VASHGTDYERYSAAIMSNGFDGSVIDMLDMNDVTQLMQSMGISISHGLRLKATFTSWKKHPDAAFEALALAKVTSVSHVDTMQFGNCLQVAASERAQAKAVAAKKQVHAGSSFLISTLCFCPEES